MDIFSKNKFEMFLYYRYNLKGYLNSWSRVFELPQKNYLRHGLVGLDLSWRFKLVLKVANLGTNGFKGKNKKLWRTFSQKENQHSVI